MQQIFLPPPPQKKTTRTHNAGGIIPNLEARLAASDVRAASTGAGQQQQQQQQQQPLISPEAAAAIALKAALGTVPDAPASLAARLRAAAANPGSSEALAAAAAAPSTKRVVHCGREGRCAAAYKQVVSLPPTASTKPAELHVYVAARGGAVLLMRNRLRTAGAAREDAGEPGGIKAAAATKPFVPKGLPVAKPLPLPAEELARGAAATAPGKKPATTAAKKPGGAAKQPAATGAKQPAAGKKPATTATAKKPAGAAGAAARGQEPGPLPSPTRGGKQPGPGRHGNSDAEDERRRVWMSLGRGNSLYSGQVPLNTAQAAGGSPAAKGGPFLMRDLIYNAETFDLMNKDDGGGAAEALFRDRDNVWGDGSPKDRATAAVDAHYGASVTLAYFKDVHGRNGVDGRGAKVRSRVHLSKAYDNAYCEPPHRTAHTPVGGGMISHWLGVGLRGGGLGWCSFCCCEGGVGLGQKRPQRNTQNMPPPSPKQPNTATYTYKNNKPQPRPQPTNLNQRRRERHDDDVRRRLARPAAPQRELRGVPADGHPGHRGARDGARRHGAHVGADLRGARLSGGGGGGGDVIEGLVVGWWWVEAGGRARGGARRRLKTFFLATKHTYHTPPPTSQTTNNNPPHTHTQPPYSTRTAASTRASPT